MSPALLIAAALSATPSAELLDFTATWCGPCQNMRPIVERLQREGYPVRQIDVDQQRALASRFRITGMPTFVLVVDGNEVDRKIGACSETHLRQMLAKIPASDPAPPEETPKKRRWPNLFGRKEVSETVEPPMFDTADDVPVMLGQSPDEPPERSPAPGVAPEAASDPLQTAVRIRVKDEQGVDYGSGTLIAFQNGRGLALTCWHIFRDFGKDATVEVDLFPNGSDQPPQTVLGRLIKANEDADVAVIGIVGCPEMPVSPIVPPNKLPKVGDYVCSVGCDGGKAPTKLQHRVTRLNPYQGPGTTECTGMPVSGRSGGGLFDASGRIIGVCFAADRDDERGVYVGTEEIHRLLKDANYTALVPPPAEEENVTGSTPNVFSSEVPAVEPSSPAEQEPKTGNVVAETEVAGSEGDSAVALNDLVANLGGNVEATIILHRRDKPELPSQVYVIPKVSNRFQRYLRGEIDPPTVETALRVKDSSMNPRSLSLSERKSRRELDLVPASPERTIALLARVFNNHH